MEVAGPGTGPETELSVLIGIEMNARRTCVAPYIVGIKENREETLDSEMPGEGRKDSLKIQQFGEH